MSVKLAVIYYSSTGTVARWPSALPRPAEKAGAEVRLRHVAELAPDEVDRRQRRRGAAHVERHQGRARWPTPDDIVWADAVLFGTPTRFGNVASQLKQFLDTLGPQWGRASWPTRSTPASPPQTAHGGQESTLLALYNTVHHFGGIVVPPGYTDPVKFADGNPYGVSHVTGAEQRRAPRRRRTSAALDHLVERVLDVTRRLAIES